MLLSSYLKVVVDSEKREDSRIGSGKRVRDLLHAKPVTQSPVLRHFEPDQNG